MPKSTYKHANEAVNTDRKFRPEDEGIYTQEKQEFQASEKSKKADEQRNEESAKPDHEQGED